MRLSRKLSLGEEIANSVSHGVMFLGGLFLLPWTAIYSYGRGNLSYAVGSRVFVIALLLMFLSSTLYHAMAYDSPHKRVFRILDHSCIFIAIAGSYTPVALTALRGSLGVMVVLIQWALVIGGILYKVLGDNCFPKLSLILYLSMGWLVILFLPRMISQTNITFMIYLIAGGLMYTIGAFFYSRKTMPYHHLVWHLFINLASICHFIAIIFYL